MASTRWYYVESGQQRGPIDFEALVDLLRADKLSTDTLVWSPGRQGWSTADAVAEIWAKLPPPIPATASGLPITREPPPVPRTGATLPLASLGQRPPAIPASLAATASSDRAARVGKWLALSAVILLLVDAGGCAYLLSRPMKDGTKVAESFGELTVRLAFLSAVAAWLTVAIALSLSAYLSSGSFS